MYSPVEHFLGSDYIIKKQVRAGSKVVDIFAISKVGEETIAIELKVDKWRQALRQAAIYQVFAKHSYVALHRSHISPALKHEMLFRQLGVGLMSVKRDVLVHIEPLPSRFVKMIPLEMREWIEPSGENGS